MASRRHLKKKINSIFDNLIIDLLTIDLLYPATDTSQTDQILSEIIETTSELTCRAHHAPGKHNTKEIKRYYAKLHHQLQAAAQKQAAAIGAFAQAAKKGL